MASNPPCSSLKEQLRLANDLHLLFSELGRPASPAFVAVRPRKPDAASGNILPAFHGQSRAGDETGLLAGEEHDGTQDRIGCVQGPAFQRLSHSVSSPGIAPSPDSQGSAERTQS